MPDLPRFRLFLLGTVLSAYLAMGTQGRAQVESFDLPAIEPEVQWEEFDPEAPTEEFEPEAQMEELKPETQTEEREPEIQMEELKPVQVKPQRAKNPVAEFTGVDKITGRIITFDVYIDETVQFGALQVTPRVCYSRPKEDEPKTDSFVEVDEITLDRKIRRIFTGWMFAESPGLNAVEHAVYDVWLKSCKQTSDVPAPKTN